MSGRSRRQAGFTLLELLVALAVFAVVAALAYSGLDQVLRSEREIRQRAERLEALQRAVAWLGRDIGYLVARGIRDEYGDSEAALLVASYGDYRLRLTHAGGYALPHLKRSELQRVAWGIDNDGWLVRHSWLTLDRAQGSEPMVARLLAEVEGLEIRLLHEQNWIDAWPPLDQPPGGGADTLPRAIEITFTVAGFGAIRRIFTLVGAA
jgi:general secretion pathway protein J